MATSRHHTHDTLLARVNLAERRLGRLQADLADDVALAKGELHDRATRLTARAKALASRIRSWTEVEIGAGSAVDDLTASVDTLESDLTAARATEAEGYGEAVDRQVRTWRARIDHLRVQGGLASMEAKDELDELTHRLEDVRSAVLADLQDVIGDARDVVIDLREDVEKTLVGVRQTVERAAASLTGDESD